MFWTGTDTPPHVARPRGHLHAFALGAGARLCAAGHAGFRVWRVG